MAGYSDTDKSYIINGAEDAYVNIILDALCKDEFGCNSDLAWRMVWNINSILTVLDSTLTKEQEDCLLERLIDYKNKPIN